MKFLAFCSRIFPGPLLALLWLRGHVFIRLRGFVCNSMAFRARRTTQIPRARLGGPLVVFVLCVRTRWQYFEASAGLQRFAPGIRRFGATMTRGLCLPVTDRERQCPKLSCHSCPLCGPEAATWLLWLAWGLSRRLRAPNTALPRFAARSPASRCAWTSPCAKQS